MRRQNYYMAIVILIGSKGDLDVMLFLWEVWLFTFFGRRNNTITFF